MARKGVDLTWKALTLKVTWPFDHTANVRLREKLKKLHFQFHKAYGH